MSTEFGNVVDLLISRHERRSIAEKPYSDYQNILNAKENVLRRFQPAFRPEAIGQLSEDTMRDFLSFKHNRHWTGLHRSAGKICSNMPGLRASLKHLFDETIPVDVRVDDMDKNGTHAVTGMSVGTFSPMLLVRNPSKYGVWNTKASSAMKMLGIWPRHSRGETKGQQYANLNGILLRLADATGLDLWSLDGLWHVINEECRLGIKSDLNEEIEEQRLFFEGTRKLTTGFQFERDAAAREECIKYRGKTCIVCGFDFYQHYGELGLGFIHVHHLSDISLSGEREIDPKKDLVPVCPNCHAMLHRRAKPSRSIERLREIIASAQRGKGLEK